MITKFTVMDSPMVEVLAVPVEPVVVVPVEVVVVPVEVPIAVVPVVVVVDEAEELLMVMLPEQSEFTVYVPVNCSVLYMDPVVAVEPEGSATICPAPLKSRYPITAAGWDEVVVEVVVVVVPVVVPVPVVVLVPVVVPVVPEALVCSESGVRTKP